ncbi:histidine phosphatase family protein [Arthrobacter sp. zg-Y820]|uniref:histidine phosphatase family protein n=1 Tax=unclassified Arthrobacter TaxID=235627 RepID=UPI001E55AE81|nr:MULTISPECIES: histidine phosphatase family protein [unclassified Arthrobacter]MCC9195615.1 histidine phosphatase family protein [Arthrobacter sp. zg-Y820]MDK1278474.1 histidine phosphatase family protein [Arthrobacter sp. zg.Y820]MDK1359921.1 histidine phosphatase family protein [Arthrobacter sp. zg-Y1219]WIB09089.1 histidine phosphatase family protein [Arthrobacter sp. zg-Y820]
MGATELILIRHGESAGNLAATAAMRSGAEVIDIDLRDADVPLSDDGVLQGEALGRLFDGLPRAERPDSVWCSPYLRARQTAELAGLQDLRVDERLRDRELGILDLLTSAGVTARFPDEAQRRNWLGKFSYRPPGGESWADVALRLRSVLRDLDEDEDGGRVAVVCHDAVIMLIRYICERLSEQELLEIAASTSVRNASVTRLVRPSGHGRWTLKSFNAVDHLESGGAPVTEHAGDEEHVQPR